MALPLAPPDLARAYADVAFGYHKRLPELEERIDKAHGVAIAAHAVNTDTQIILQRLVARVEDVALATKAKRTTSGQMAAVSVPPSSGPIVLPKTTPSKTGSHQIVPTDEFNELVAKLREKDAEDRGRALAQAQERADAEWEMKISKARFEKWSFILAVLAFAGTIGGGIGGWVLAHAGNPPAPPVVSAPH